MNYGKAIEDVRVNRMKQTQKIFAEAVGVTQTHLSQVENGIKSPSIQLLNRIADYVDLPIPILFWNTITEEDIKPNRVEAFRLLKKPIDAVIETFF